MNFPSHVQFGTGERPSIPNYLTQAGAGGRTDINPGDYNYPGTTYAPFSDTIGGMRIRPCGHDSKPPGWLIWWY